MRPAGWLSSKGACRLPSSRASRTTGSSSSTTPELPGIEQFRIDAVSRLWRWHHETYTVSSPPVPLHVEWRYRTRLHRTEPVTVALMEPGEVHVEVSKADRHERQRVLFLVAGDGRRGGA